MGQIEGLYIFSGLGHFGISQVELKCVIGEGRVGSPLSPGPVASQPGHCLPVQLRSIPIAVKEVHEVSSC